MMIAIPFLLVTMHYCGVQFCFEITLNITQKKTLNLSKIYLRANRNWAPGDKFFRFDVNSN